MTNKGAPTATCEKCQSQAVRELLRTPRAAFFVCEECRLVFDVELPPRGPRERRTDPERQRKDGRRE